MEEDEADKRFDRASAGSLEVNVGWRSAKAHEERGEDEKVKRKPLFKRMEDERQRAYPDARVAPERKLAAIHKRLRKVTGFGRYRHASSSMVREERKESGAG